MRRIGLIKDPELAERFCDYLLTLSIDAKSESDTQDGESVVAIWIRDEAQVQQSRDELAEFEKSPRDSKYDVKSQAAKLRNDKIAEHQRRTKQRQQMTQKMPSGGGAPGMLQGLPVRQQTIPVTIAIMVLSIACTLATNFAKPTESREPGKLTTSMKLYLGLSFVDYVDYVKSGGEAFASIKKGQLWRLITPMFLHGTAIHLAFNMMALFVLGGLVERLHGSIFFALLFLVTGIAGTFLQVFLPDAASLPEALQGLAGTPFSIGASGAVYGVFGYLWMRPNFDPNFPVVMSPNNVLLMMGWLVVATFMVDGIANGAHIGGLIGGIAIAAIVAAQKKS